MKNSEDYIGRMAAKLQNALVDVVSEFRSLPRDFEPGARRFRSDLALTMDEQHDAYLLHSFVETFRQDLSEVSRGGRVIRWWSLPVVEVSDLPEPEPYFTTLSEEDAHYDGRRPKPWLPRVLVVRFCLEL